MGGVIPGLAGDGTTNLRAATDNAIDLGTSSQRFKDVYAYRTILGTAAIQILTGAGTPEAAVTAPVGSLFLRSDGGASTTLYVKQNGTGNTGWVAK